MLELGAYNYSMNSHKKHNAVFQNSRTAVRSNRATGKTGDI